MQVKVINQQIDKALRILKRKLAKEGVFKEHKKRRFYEKPSEKKRRKQNEARKRKFKANRAK